MKLKFSHLILFSLFIIQTAFGQTNITGVVYNAETKQPVPFASIWLKQTGKGTMANEKGAFKLSLQANYTHDSLVISAIGYELKQLNLTEHNSPLSIQLVSKSYDIDEIVFKKRKPEEIIRKAIKNIPNNFPQKQHTLKAFYREMIQENGVYVKMSEAICKFKLSPYKEDLYSTEAALSANENYISAYGDYNVDVSPPLSLPVSPFDNHLTVLTDSVEIIQSRCTRDYSKCPRQLLVGGGPLKLIALDKVRYRSFDLMNFFNEKWFKKHSFKLKDIIPFGDRKLYKIEIIPNGVNKAKQSPAKNYYKGEIYIETESYAIARLNYSVLIHKPDGYKTKIVDGFGKKNKYRTDKAIFHTANVEINYNEINSKWYPQRISTSWPLEYEYDEGKSIFSINTTRELYLYEVLTENTYINKQRTILNTYNSSLYNFYAPYDSLIWNRENFPPNSSLNDSIINSFNKKESLESQFINTKNYDASLKAPKAKRELTKDSILNSVFSDEYSWLEDKSDSLCRNYIQQENKYTINYLKKNASLNKNLFHELLKDRDRTQTLSNDTIGKQVYFWSKPHGKLYANFYRKEVGKQDSILLIDINEKRKLNEYYDVSITSVSRDQKKLMYGVDHTGNLQFHIYIKDISTGEITQTNIKNTNNIYWSNDGTKLIYSNYEDGGLSSRLYIYNLRTHENKLIFKANIPEFELNFWQSEDKEYFIIAEQNQFADRIYYLQSDLNEMPSLLLPYKDKVGYSVTHTHNHFWVLSNEEYVNNALYKIDQKSLTKELIVKGSNALIKEYRITNKYLIILESEDLKDRIRVFNKSDFTEIHSIEFKGDFYQLSLAKYASLRESVQVEYRAFNLLSPIKYELSLINGKRRKLNTPKKTKFRYRLDFAQSTDGTMIPISIISKGKLKKNAKSPVLIKAYGAFGNPVSAQLTEADKILLNKGFVIAYPHVRGGNDLGMQWWEQGRAMQKHNTFNDFISCTNLLIDKKYCHPQKLVASGGSAGGLLMGVLANKAPELFNTIILEYPMLDMLNNLSQNKSIQYEWGDIMRNQKELDYVMSYSPYANIKKQAYPNMMFITSITDERCHYWESAKSVARIRNNNSSKNTILLLTKYSGGHGGFNSLNDYYREEAAKLSFLISNINF